MVCGAALPLSLLIALGISFQPRTHGKAASGDVTTSAPVEPVSEDGAWTENRPVPETSVAWRQSETETQGRPLQVYECSNGGQRVLSDRPCGTDATVRGVDLAHQNTYRESPVASARYASAGVRQSGRSGSSFQSGSVPMELWEPGVNCAAIERELEVVNAQLRAGYREPKGNRLRAKRRRLHDLLDTHCLRR